MTPQTSEAPRIPGEDDGGSSARGHTLPGTISKKLFPIIRDEIEKLTGSTLAEFRWDSGARSGGMRLALKAREGTQWTLQIGPVDDPTDSASLLINVTVTPTIKDSREWLVTFLFPTRDGKRRYIYWPVLDVSELDWGDTGEDEESVSSSGIFRGPHGSLAKQTADAVMAQFGQTWFFAKNEDKDTKQKKAALGPGVVAQRHPASDLLKEYWPSFHEDGGIAWRIPLPPFRIENGAMTEWDAASWAKCVLAALSWALMVYIFRHGPLLPTEWTQDSDLYRWLPRARDYKRRRPVNLVPSFVFDYLAGGRAGDSTHDEQEGQQRLRLPWHVVESACAALNAGKHVIFTGPPGCGKSKLAAILAKLATGHPPVLATASPAWTSADLIGRYMPSPTGAGLDFKPGIFLRTVERPNRWLLIDEFNRANIDECFGELFSVLAGDVAELPFEMATHSLKDDQRVFRPVRIVPAAHAGESSADDHVDFTVSDAFRILGTMNDADRSQLHELSFALQRRFHIIRVEAPEPKIVQTLIKDEIKEMKDQLELDKNSWRIKPEGAKKHSVSVSLDDLVDEFYDLFAYEPGEYEEVTRSSSRKTKHLPREFDLVRERIVGVATVFDIIRFVAEGLRADTFGAGSKGKWNLVGFNEENNIRAKDAAEELALSYLAMALVLAVFPQLDALRNDVDRFRRAIEHILWTFGDRNMRQIEKSGDDADLQFELQKNPKRIAKFLHDELERRYHDTGLLDSIDWGSTESSA